MSSNPAFLADDLRLMDERHRMLAQSANDVLWTMSPSGEITYVSPSVEALRGLTPEEAMAQPLEEILTPESVPISMQYFADLQAAVAAGEDPPSFRGELEYYCSDGSTIWCDLQVIPCLSEDGEIIELLGVSRDVTERKRQDEALAAAREEAAAARLAAERERARQEERERMAQDLHDDLLQTLAAVKGHIGMLEAREHDTGDEQARKYLERSKQDLTRAIESARRLVRGRAPAHLEERGLAGALSALCDEAAERYGLDVEFVCTADADDCAPEVSEALYRVTQEALNNAGQHAQARQLHVAFDQAPDGAVVVRIADDGVGFTAGDSDGLGVPGMRHRMQQLAGSLGVSAGTPAGTVVEARLPASALR